MKTVVTKISLDITKSGSQVLVPLFYGDTNRTLQFKLTEGSKPYDLSDCSVAFTGKKSDGTFLNNSCDIDFKKQVVIYDVNKDENTKQTTACKGSVRCQLIVYKQRVVDGETITDKVASPYFDIVVMETVYNDEEIIESASSFGLFDKLYVPLIRKIAGIELSDDIDAEALCEALGVYTDAYPVLNFGTIPPTIETEGIVNQLGFTVNYDGKKYSTELYICVSNLNNKYVWRLFGGVDGITPHIGDNGNWFIGDTDSGLPSRGEKGEKGDTGATGAQGLQGESGADGKDGFSPTISVSSSDTGYILTIAHENFVENVPIKNGVDGASAYEVACDNGFEGTEEEWLDSLKSLGSFEDLQSYAIAIQNAQTNSTLTLALMADPHYCSEENTAKQIIETANRLGELSNYVKVDALVNLGDMVRGDDVKSVTRNDLAKLIVNTNLNAKCPVLYIRGNHDDNGWYSLDDETAEEEGRIGTHLPDEMFNEVEWYQMVFGFTHKDIVIDKNKPYGGYGYFDHNDSKIRVFLLNSVDIPYVLNENGTYRYNSYQCYAFSNEQLNFVANALKFEDKDNPNEWAAMFLTHVSLDTTNDDGYRFGGTDALIRGHIQMLGIISAYRKGINYAFSGSVNNVSNANELEEDFTVNIDVDYSAKGVGDVICFVNGHIHTDNCSQKVGYENSLSYGYTYLGVIGSTSFATMVVNREDSTVTVFKYGEVRPQSATTHNDGAIDGEVEFGIDMSTGTWVVPFEQFRPTNESIYNGLSELWGDGYYINSSATLDLDTLELSTADENSKWAISKGVAVKSSTQYAIPSDFVGEIRCYKDLSGGTANGSLTPVDGDTCKIITTKDASHHLVFVFHKANYPDYENFYIKEYIATTESGESDG